MSEQEQDYLNEIYDLLNKPVQQRSQEPPAARNRRKRRKRRFPWLTLLVFLLAGALVFAVVQYRKDRTEAAAPSTEPTQSPTAAKDGDVLTIAAAGDINITEELLQSARQADGSYNFSSMFLGAASLLSGADLTVADLEVNFCGAPYDPDRYNAPESLLTALSEVGVDLVQTANTASVYNGVAGLSSTLEAVRNAGLEPVGTFDTEETAKRSKGFTLVEIKGFRVAFVAFTKGVGNLKLPEGAEHCVNLLYTDYNTTYQNVNTGGIEEVLSRVQSEKPDIVIALLHWGSEYDSTVSKTQEEIRDLMLKGGVNVILGTHSHLVGPLEITTSQNGQMLTAYSLGNLLSTDDESGANQGIILNLEFTKSGGVTSLTDYRYDPIYLANAGETASGKFEILNTKDAVSLYESSYIGRVSQEVYESLCKSLERVEEAVKKQEDERTLE